MASDQSTRREADAALMNQIAAGDAAALEVVFKEYGGAIKSMALRVLRNESLAEETVQEVFVDLWKAPQKFDPTRGNLRTFLITIAHRRAVDAVRSEQARYNREEKVPDDAAPSSVEDQVWSLSLSESVREALERLSDGEREAITLAYYGGMSYADVAKKLGQPEGTVKSRIRSGMRKMGDSLVGVST